jgi:ribosomal protein L37AE/L43A
MSAPKCPKCKTAKHARPNGHRLFYCAMCDMLYDDSGDDGTITYGDPARIVERNERITAAQKRERKLAERSKLKGGLGR